MRQHGITLLTIALQASHHHSKNFAREYAPTINTILLHLNSLTVIELADLSVEIGNPCLISQLCLQISLCHPMQHGLYGRR